MRTLLCTATNMTPHERFLPFPRQSVNGSTLPDFLLNNGTKILHKRHITGKLDCPTETVTLQETLSPHFARVQFPDGRADTVTTRCLSPMPQPSIEPSSEPADSSQPTDTRFEVDTEDNAMSSSEIADVSDSVYRTRSGREVKPVERFQ